jgi:hypothetical protein
MITPIMKRFILIVFLAFVPVGAAEEAKFARIFDGKTFQGWEGETNKTFRIEEGAIVGGNLREPIPRNEFLCTDRSYTNFVLKLQFKLLGGEKANAGVQIRTQRIPNHHEVIGYQADMGDGWWGSLYDESRRNRILAKADAEEVDKVLKRNDWNEYVIRCEGKRVRLWINGYQTVDYTELDDALEQHGIIGLQIHSGPPSEAWYREIYIQELP